ncbi:MAG: hypothetical protein ACJAVS_001532 [Paracoccaceae bacterium]|jgi:hypothetical protein
MFSPFGWRALAILLLYIALFFRGGAMAACAAGRSIRLVGQATGRDRLAAVGFRAAFGLPIQGDCCTWPDRVFTSEGPSRSRSSVSTQRP